ncbi:helix-turn-helix domain-containing protein, partial [Actinocorallia lasiicapitis]
RIRRAQGRTLADVARSAKISMPYLSELERGRKEASSEVLAAVCEALRVEQADVLTEIGRTMTLARHAAERRAASIALRRPAGSGDVYCLAA